MSRSSPPPDLVVWPETAVAVPLPELGWSHALRMRLGGVGSRSALLTGANVAGAEQGAPVRLFNSAVLLDQPGRVCRRCRYDKRRLVPFAEALPFAVLRPLFPRGALYRPGDGAEPLLWRDHSLGVMLCFEALDAEIARGLVEQGAEILINLTNDAWFIPGSEPHLHFALARLRAIEQGRFLVRAAERGVSAVVDPRGRVLRASRDLTSPDVLTQQVKLLRDRTPYSHHGDLPWCLTALGFVLLTAARRLFEV